MSQTGTGTEHPTSAGPEPAPSYPIREPLPVIHSPLDPGPVVERLSVASRRGRLAGFEAGPGPTAFRATVFSEPFDHQLAAQVTAAPSGGSEIRSTARMMPRLPIIFAVVLLATVWPGVVLTDSMIPGEWGWIDTWIWYIPITALPLPWLWMKWMKKCRAAAGVSAYELLHKLAAEVDGRVEARPSASLR